MNLMIKVLLISSLFSSFTSCKLYKDIDKSQQDLANNKSLLEEDNKRNTRKARSISYREINNQEQNNQNISNKKEAKDSEKGNNSNIQKDGILNTTHSVTSYDSEKHTSRQTQQVNNESREAKQARNIIQETSAYLEEVEKITASLETTRSELDKIKSTLDDARSYFNNARSRSSKANPTNPTLLPNLDQAISKVNSNYASANSNYSDAVGALANSKNDFEYAQRKANDALQEALNNSNAVGYQYAGYHYYMADAKDTMIKAKVSLETTKNKQKCLNSNIEQANAELEELNKAYEAALQATES
ncbi:immunogenic protein P37 (plasmid) [Borrelia sp. A-FGy1]|uniref:immunogenic protein P37 n=1 Tax=Borrelia sp. A-FGy1 TaxID=2608247 RepID=UPI0015F60D0E|nr:immunogenic protein P37 [Borrelia sp. A-FGy1]QMU99818.1 immunogenic protein P37 [Borrelia sp. A-FGy1]